ncbi:MAG: hypothetical protein IPH09_09035 [bacterium]|nr:hypothetical protein [bacterium]
MHPFARIGVAALMLTIAVGPVVAQEFTPDAHTLLLLHGNGSLLGAAGESPTSATGAGYTDGVFGQAIDLPNGSQLRYAAANNLVMAAGTVEFWLKPHWDGDDGGTYLMLTWGTWGGLLLAKDGADNLRIMINRWSDHGLPERGASCNVAGEWAAEQWHHCAFTWDSDFVRVYIDGVKRGEEGVGFTPPAIAATQFQIGGEGADGTLQGAIDEWRISNVVRSAAEIEASFLAGLAVTDLAAAPRTTKPWVTWPVHVTLTATTQVGEIEIPQGAADWSTSDADVVSVQPDGSLRAVGEGTATLTATYRGHSASCDLQVRAPALAPTHEALPADLTTPATGAIWEVPVLVIRYFATADGVNLDTSISPDFWWLNPLTLAQLDADVLAMNRRTKFALEQGSRFRAYDDPQARPSLGYRVVDQITVYEQTPPGKIVGYDQDDPLWEADWFAIFDRLDVRHYVEDLGVKEIWVWTGSLGRWPSFDPVLHDVADFRGGWESNMSSPLTGDISNSNRDPSDLPVYDKTYVVYGYNFRRSQAEAIHDHGHQLESQFAWVNEQQDGNTDLFWKQWRGQDQDGNKVTGRCGDTHSPPNTLADYDYENQAVVLSDIADWTADGSGAYAPVTVDTWGSPAWPWPDGVTDFGQRVETQWYMYWMMSMPGFDNGLAYGDEALGNWWEFIGSWDQAVAAGHGLHGPDSTTGAPPPRDEAAAPLIRFLLANPSAGTSSFEVTASGDGRLEVGVYDVRGHLVRLLHRGPGSAAPMSFTWDARDEAGRAVAAGAYLLRVREGARLATHKLVIVR